MARASIRQAGRVRSMLEEVSSAQKISEEISHFAALLERVVSQTRRRVLEGEQVLAPQKLVSIFEPHTAIIRRGKAKKLTEFGRKVWLSEVDRRIVSGFRIGLDPGGRTDQSFGYRVRRRRSKGCREQHHAIHRSSEQRR